MPLLNYTTQIDAGKTVAEIQMILSCAGALAIMTEFDAGVLVGISFRIGTPYGPTSYALPCNVESVLKILHENSKVPRRLVNKEQAARVGWRIIKDWIEAQLALVETKMVTLDQVFLPYARMKDGKTLYARCIESGINNLLLTE
jgi:hypothetical protein